MSICAYTSEKARQNGYTFRPAEHHSHDNFLISITIVELFFLFIECLFKGY